MKWNLDSLGEILNLIGGMSPYLLLGFLIAGLMHAYLPGNFYRKYLSGENFRSVFNAALLGIPLPLCSCGVLPTAMSLRKEGASRGAVISFLTSTPQTGVDSIIATYAMMGLPFAVIRPIAALVTALLGGFLTDRLGKHEDTCHGHGGHSHEEHGCCCHSHEEHSHEEHGCCCHGHGEHSHEGGRLHRALRYAFVEMMEDIGKWLVVGLVVAAFITVCVPTDFFAIFNGNTLASMLLVLAIAIPMYICATGSIPIAVALLLKGLTPGAALVLLMAGPACNMASVLVVRRTLGTRTVLVYMLSLVLGAVAFGVLIDWLHFSGAVSFLPPMQAGDACHEAGANLWELCCSSVLALLLFNALVFPKWGLK